MNRTQLGFLLTAVAASGATGVLAQSTDAPHVITNPTWLTKPTGEVLANLYPAAAQHAEVSGGALLRCQVKADGTLESCAVLAENPRGLGFGEAALKASRYFRMRPRTADGKPVTGAAVTIPITWRIADEPPPLRLRTPTP